ncbi:class I SAM-dependent methyltransferase [Phreatobacter sp.]|uniref:class I SAM-dependent methyltransferase n=1 Tax=Phreatobacter sp. TaxID=1966341 RepID=UPI003F6EB04B
MSFSPDWLALREPADHAARSAVLLNRVAGHFAGRSSLNVVDLGCGTGSNLRALAPHLPDRQRWHLVDLDQSLLAAARTRLATWADEAGEEDNALVLLKGRKQLKVSFVGGDLTRDLDRLLNPGAELVTAAALFDLASAPFIDAFVDELAVRRLPLYTVLTYDGAERWEPPHPADAAMLAAFHAHQKTDKGFGRAAGPAASRVLAESFGRAGYRVLRAPSPWRLGAADAKLMAELATGFAGAVRETGQVPDSAVEEWLKVRLSGSSCEVGHEDLFAWRD